MIIDTFQQGSTLFGLTYGYRSTISTGSLLFASLCAVVLPLVSLHDSSADSEIMFSMVKKTDIDCKSDLSQGTVACSVAS